MYLCIFFTFCALSQGASANWWNHRHFQHHAKPNVITKDPDVNMLNAFVVGDVQPLEVNAHQPRIIHT